MYKRILLIVIAVSISVAILMSFTGCSLQNNKLETTIAPTETELNKQTLYISQCFDFYELERSIEEFKLLHPNTEIILNKYDGDVDRYTQQVTTMLMAGNADDVLDATGINNSSPAAKVYFTDIFPLMQKDPSFAEEDYYMSVFDGMAVNGKLTAFPIFFNYSLVGLNNTIIGSGARELAEYYKSLDRITYSELLDLYHNLNNNFGRYVYKDIDAITVINASINDFVDYENNVCDLNNERFIHLINNAKSATLPQRIAYGELGLLHGKYMSITNQEEAALQYLFDDVLASDYQAFFPMQDGELFAHYIPTTSENGKLMLIPTKRFCISEASENKELAWEFIKYLTTPEANENNIIPSFPVHRPLFKEYIEKEITLAVDYWRNEGYNVDGETTDIVAHVLAVYNKFNEMPMHYHEGIISVGETVREVLTQFHNDLLSAEQAALELQNKISLHLMEVG